MTTLNEARSAAQELKRLQEAASMLPELERQQSAYDAKAKIEALKQKTLADNHKLYAQFQHLYSKYRQQFVSLLESVKECHNTLKSLYDLRKAILDNRSKYAGALLEYSLKFEGLDVYKDGYLIEDKAEAVTPFTLPRVISISIPGNPLAGAIEEILNRL
jgi:hypothetical protein